MHHRKHNRHYRDNKFYNYRLPEAFNKINLDPKTPEKETVLFPEVILSPEILEQLPEIPNPSVLIEPVQEELNQSCKLDSAPEESFYDVTKLDVVLEKKEKKEQLPEIPNPSVLFEPVQEELNQSCKLDSAPEESFYDVTKLDVVLEKKEQLSTIKDSSVLFEPVQEELNQSCKLDSTPEESFYDVTKMDYITVDINANDLPSNPDISGNSEQSSNPTKEELLQPFIQTKPSLLMSWVKWFMKK